MPHTSTQCLIAFSMSRTTMPICRISPNIRLMVTSRAGSILDAVAALRHQHGALEADYDGAVGLAAGGAHGADALGRARIRLALGEHLAVGLEPGAGSLMSLQPRLAIAFWLTSATLIPATSDRVRQELTSGRPNSDLAA